MATEVFTARAESELVHQLDHVADSDRSRIYLIDQAIKEYREHNAWQIEKITPGIAAADRG